MKKRLIFIAVVAALCLPFTGCGNTTSTPTTTETQEYFADNDFIKDLQKGLESRWSIASDNVLSMTTDELKAYYEQSVNSELDIIEKYQNEKFEDRKLQEIVIQYINLLKDSKEVIPYLNTDMVTFSQDWDMIYKKRSQMISSFHSDFGLTVSEEYESTLNDFISISNIVTQQESQKDTIDNWVKSIVFEQVDDSHGYQKYQATVENTTGFNFEYINLSINLIDTDGVVVQTVYSSFQNISAGAKVKFEFSTNTQFSSTDVTAKYQVK